MLAAIPYTTFPIIEIGPLQIRTFGLMVGTGVLVGAWLAARHAERTVGESREDTYRLATRMVVAGIIGARLTWDVTHWDQIDSPLDVFAVWQGGLQFSGGFLAAVAVGMPTFRKWRPGTRGHLLDGYAYGLTLGLAIGRIGCYSVGEHFGSLSDFALAVRYDGGAVRENDLGSVKLLEGMTFHNTALYEFGYLVVLFAALHWLIRRKSPPGTVLGVFGVVYGISRFLTDFLRVNDETVLGLTGAQWLCLALIPTGVWVMRRAQARTTAEAEPGEDDAEAESDEPDRESEPDAELESGEEPEPAVESTET